MHNRVVALLESLGVQIDVTVVPGAPPKRLSKLYRGLGTMLGMQPDCRMAPRSPYRPARDDFRKADAARRSGIWMFPLSARPLGSSLPLFERAKTLLRPLLRRQNPPAPALVLRSGPRVLARPFEQILAESPRPYFLFVFRTGTFAVPAVWRRIAESLEYILQHSQSRRFRFVTPHKALEILSLSRPDALQGEPQDNVRSHGVATERK
jgi:hypothetical protein